MAESTALVRVGCSANSICVQRRRAIQAGEMMWDTPSRNWLWPITMHSILVNYPEYGWTFCPFCGGEI